ncbi:MAG: DUF3237 domain-containing protein [Acidobacteriota bacterium]|nr:DUF3237 domain-containing protein [Acidobacteriota bacterium]
MTPRAPELEFVCQLRVTIGEATETGLTPAGRTRVIPITGGSCTGPRLLGTVLPGGADWQLVRPDGTTLLNAQYALETAEGARVEIHNQGVRFDPQGALARMQAGEVVDPSAYYFRTTPRFHTAATQYQWLMQSVFVADAERYVDCVMVRVWRVL